jgi:hypothetical protein
MHRRAIRNRMQLCTHKGRLLHTIKLGSLAAGADAEQSTQITELLYIW